MKIDSKVLASGVVLIVAIPALAQQVWPPPYAAIEVQSEHASAVSVYGINGNGTIAGSLSGPNYGFVWRRGAYLLLQGFNPNYAAYAVDINDQGWIVGHGADFVHSSPVPTLWIDGEPMPLGTLGGEWGEAKAVNDSGHIVGWSKNEDGYSRAFLWRDGHMSDLGTLGVLGSWAWGMNNLDQVVGHSFSDDPKIIGQRAFLWDHGVMTDLGVLPNDGNEARALNINDLGQIVGKCVEGGPSGNSVAFLWEKNGQMRSIHNNELGQISEAEAINNSGQVVGYTVPDSQSVVTNAFIWDAENGMRNLEDLCPPNIVPKRWNPADINEHGQITVSAQRGNPFNGGRYVSLLVTPVHPTMTLEAPTPGAAGVENTFTLSGATPGATVRFFYSLRGGGEIIPGCATRVNALQLARPTLLGTAVADANGNASVTALAPTFASGREVLFQAVVQGECAISELVRWEFE